MTCLICGLSGFTTLLSVCLNPKPEVPCPHWPENEFRWPPSLQCQL